jgi:hypothetical protein
MSNILEFSNLVFNDTFPYRYSTKKNLIFMITNLFSELSRQTIVPAYKL